LHLCSKCQKRDSCYTPDVMNVLRDMSQSTVKRQLNNRTKAKVIIEVFECANFVEKEVSVE